MSRFRVPPPVDVDAREVAALDTEIGRVLFHSTDEIMTPFVRAHRVWEAGETRFLQATLRPGHVFVDCGANVGWFSVLATQLVGPDGLVVAVEPERRNLDLLTLNLWQHANSRTVVLPVAAGDERGLLGLHLDEGNRGDHQAHALEVGDLGRAARVVPVAPLDELLGAMPVDVVKVDVQGYDHEVVAGLARTLAASRDPVVLVEFWLTGMEQRGIDAQTVLDEYRGAGFALSLLERDGTTRSADDAKILDVAEDGGTRVVNIVMRRS